jgi:hypothetical protein
LIAFASLDASAADRVRVFGAASCADLSCAKLSCAVTITFQSEGRRRILVSTFGRTEDSEPDGSYIASGRR